MKPKCKLCGSPHWTYEEHKLTGTEELQKVGASVLRNTVTKPQPVTKVPNNVTPVTTPALSDGGEGEVWRGSLAPSPENAAPRLAASSNPSPPSPSVGRPKKHKSNAERQRAYRERRG